MPSWKIVSLALLGVCMACGLWWYFSVPRDLKLEKIDVARVSDFRDLRHLPQQDHYVARISFSSAVDLRKMMLQESSTDGTDVSASPCNCNEAEKEHHGDWCSVALGPFPFDRFGEVQHHYNVPTQLSSRVSQDGPRLLYHFYIPVRQWGVFETPYNLAKTPVDFCVQMSRFGYLEPARTSNLLFIPKEKLAEAIGREHVQ
jgi:hypothetical protein